jgi:hypothetical protein
MQGGSSLSPHSCLFSIFLGQKIDFQIETKSYTIELYVGFWRDPA